MRIKKDNEELLSKSMVKYSISVFAVLFAILFISLIGEKGTYSNDCGICGDTPGIGPDWKPVIVLNEFEENVFCSPGVVGVPVFFWNYIFREDQCTTLAIDHTDVIKCLKCNGELSDECKAAITPICSDGWFVSDGRFAGGINPDQSNLMSNEQVIAAANALPSAYPAYGTYGSLTFPSTVCSSDPPPSTVIEVTKPTCNDQVYDGTLKTIVNGSGSEYSLSGDSMTQTQPGTYTIHVALKDKDNYKWKDSNSSDDFDLNCKITAPDPIEVTEPTCNDQEYDTTEKLIVNGSGSEYTFGGQNIRQTNIGTYTITVTLKDKILYKWKNSGNTDDLTLNCNITPPTVTEVEEPVCVDQEADGMEKILVSATGNEYTYSGDSITQTQPGTYKIKAVLKDKIHTKWKNSGNTDDLTLNCNLTPPTVTEVEEPVCVDQEADGTQKTLVSATGSEYTYSGDSITQTQPGTYKIKATLKDKVHTKWKNSGNTNDLTLDCNLTPPTITEVPEPTCVDQEYDGEEKMLVSTIGSEYTYSGDNIKQTQDGQYTIKATLKDKVHTKWKNAQNTDDLTLICNITKPTTPTVIIVEEPVCVDQEYDGTEKILVSGSGDEYNFLDSTSGTEINSYTIRVALKDPTLYKWKNKNTSDDLTLVCNITAPPSPDATPVEEPTCVDQVYDGTEKVLVSGNGTEYTFSNNVRQKEVGTYTITVSLKDKVNYKWKRSNTTNDLTLTCSIRNGEIVDNPKTGNLQMILIVILGVCTFVTAFWYSRKMDLSE